MSAAPRCHPISQNGKLSSGNKGQGRALAASGWSRARWGWGARKELGRAGQYCHPAATMRTLRCKVAGAPGPGFAVHWATPSPGAARRAVSPPWHSVQGSPRSSPPPSSVLATVNRANPQELWSRGGARVTTTAVAASSHLRTSSPAPDLGRSDPHRPPQSTPGAWSGWLRTSREGRGRRTGRLFWFTDSLCLAVPRFPWDNRM